MGEELHDLLKSGRVTLAQLTQFDERRDLKALLSYRNIHGNTCMHRACWKDNGLDVMTWLFAKCSQMGVNPNAARDDGCTPLHSIAECGSQPEVVALLLKATGGGGLTAVCCGTTPLQWCTNHNSTANAAAVLAVLSLVSKCMLVNACRLMLTTSN